MVERYPIFMEDVPKYEVRGGHMYITWRTLELVLPVEVMLDGLASAKAEIAKWQLSKLPEGGQVVAFPRCG
jgi:hypothetical protein